jgi:hypothetical protein
MNDSQIRDNIATKIEQAKECGEKAFPLCTEYVKTNNPKLLKRMGGYMGTLANNLRSALNYASADYCQQGGFTSNKDEKKLITDFPYSYKKADFEKLKIATLMSNADPLLYSFVETLQPYNESPWLGVLMKVSNLDKHKLLVQVNNLDITSIGMWDANNNVIQLPKHMGSHLLFPSADGKSVDMVQTPCYVKHLRMFALPNGKWLMFFVILDGNPIEFLPFMQGYPKRVEKVIDNFYNKF